MTIRHALDDLNARFTYERDKREKWQILRGKGQLFGDCEDFACTLIYYAEGRSLWRFWKALAQGKYRIWHVQTARGAGHAVLEHDGLFVDNIVREFVTRSTLERFGYRFHYRRSVLGILRKFIKGLFV